MIRRKAKKAETVMELINKGYSNKEITNRMAVSGGYVSKLRSQMVHKVEGTLELTPEMEVPAGMCIHNYRANEYCPACAKPKPGEFVEASAPTSINAILNVRGSRYGKFTEHARITQNIKAAMIDSPNWLELADDQMEAVEMIAHKLGRILNGDPDYDDSWVDIAGYAQLVADRLQGKER